MIVSITQPAYIPWIGFFDRLIQSDINIVLDHVSMDMNSKTKFTNRNKIRTAEGWNWLSIPIVNSRKNRETPICDLKINDLIPWKIKHWKTIQFNYSKTKYFSYYASFFENAYKDDWYNLVSFLSHINNYLIKELNIKTKIIKSSDLKPELSKSNLILELCQKVGAKRYISGPFGRDYLDTKAFKNSGIDIHYHDYTHPTYSQAYDGFESHMSIIDLLFNHGKDSLDILKT